MNREKSRRRNAVYGRGRASSVNHEKYSSGPHTEGGQSGEGTDRTDGVCKEEGVDPPAIKEPAQSADKPQFHPCLQRPPVSQLGTAHL